MENKSSKILVLLASNNYDGNSSTMAKWFTHGINKELYDIESIHLYDIAMDAYTNENRKADSIKNPKDKEIRNLIDKVEAASHIVIATPIWNFGVPSTLKCFIDRALVSGRVWSEEKNKKIPAWGNKKVYLLFTMGAPWYGLFINLLAILQLWCVMKYYGASVHIKGIAFNSGNGSRNVIRDRAAYKNKIIERGAKLFS